MNRFVNRFVDKFENHSKPLMWCAVFLLTAFVAGCGSGGGSASSGTAIAPAVTATTPANNATGVPINRKITATFSKAMAAASITTATFTVSAPGAAAVTGTVSFDAASNTASFTPAGNLAVNTNFTATIAAAAQDLTGVGLASDFVWSFMTGTTSDTIAPTVASTTPASTATGVPTNGKITATFSKPMDLATLTPTTFSLAGPTPVSGAINYAGTTAVFTPASNLAANTTFTATITTGAKDLSGNALASNFVWTFTTGAATAAGPAPVILGTAGNYVLLAKSGISTTGTTKVVGDIGISPAAESYLTGFSEALDSTNVFATSSIVTGKIYAADMALPTPSNLTTAIGNMEAAYTDAAGRSLPDFTELGAGNISGMTLVPGLYKWGTGVLMASDITLSGGPNDVWIFQIAQNLTVSNGVIITLSGGAQPKNIFWQVAGQAILGTTSNFKGIILSQTAIVMRTGAAMNGRALAQTAVTLDANAVTQPAP